MPRLKRASSKNRRPPSRAARAPRAARQPRPKPSLPAQWEEAVRAGDRDKIAALGRRGPNDPPDTFVQIDDLVEGVPITGPAAASRPALTVWWSQDDLPEWIIFANHISLHFAKEKKRLGRRVLAKEGIPYIWQCEPPRGGKLSNELVKQLFKICRKIADGSGGRLPDKGNG
jgi:hypothetical protein